QGRRWMGVGMLYFLGALLLYVAFATPPETAFQIMLIVLGLAGLGLGEKMRRATEGRLVLTEAGLFDGEGLKLAAFEDFASVERGFLAFKPSNGFLLHLKTRAPRRWHPGLYWRFGRTIGVGGVTAAAQGKIMADMIAARLMMRDGRR
ncbi:MAG: hypothetical protein EP307_10030, partial [Rhodobacteraceae bacterium]